MLDSDSSLSFGSGAPYHWNRSQLSATRSAVGLTLLTRRPSPFSKRAPCRGISAWYSLRASMRLAPQETAAPRPVRTILIGRFHSATNSVYRSIAACGHQRLRSGGRSETALARPGVRLRVSSKCLRASAGRCSSRTSSRRASWRNNRIRRLREARRSSLREPWLLHHGERTRCVPCGMRRER